MEIICAGMLLGGSLFEWPDRRQGQPRFVKQLLADPANITITHLIDLMNNLVERYYPIKVQYGLAHTHHAAAHILQAKHQRTPNLCLGFGKLVFRDALFFYFLKLYPRQIQYLVESF